MDADQLLADLALVADGCERHPAYRAKRLPTAKCGRCLAVKSARDRVLRHASEAKPFTTCKEAVRHAA